MLTFENILEFFKSICCVTRRKKSSPVSAATSD